MQPNIDLTIPESVTTIFNDPLDDSSMIHIVCIFSLCRACHECDCQEHQPKHTNCCTSHHVPNSALRMVMIAMDSSSNVVG